MSSPSRLFSRGHLHRRFRGSEAVKSVQHTSVSRHISPTLQNLVRRLICASPDSSTHLCISPAVPLSPFHIKITMPVMAMNSRNLVRVRKFHIAREGGSRDLADFQVTPPLGSNMVLVWVSAQRASKDCVSPSARLLLRSVLGGFVLRPQNLRVEMVFANGSGHQWIVCETCEGGVVSCCLEESLRHARTPDGSWLSGISAANSNPVARAHGAVNFLPRDALKWTTCARR